VGIWGPHFNGNVCTFTVNRGLPFMLHPLSPPVASFFCPKTHSSTSRVEIVPSGKFVGFGKIYDFYVLDFGDLKPSKVANHWLIHQHKQFQQTRATVSPNRMKSSTVPTKLN